MFKMTKGSETADERITMAEMEPCQIGVITTKGEYYGHIVMRNAYSVRVEVMSLTNPGGR